MIGVELDSWDPEANDGSLKGYRYFTAPEGRDVFVKRINVLNVIPLENDPDIKQINPNTLNINGSSSMDEDDMFNSNINNNNYDPLNEHNNRYKIMK